MEAADIFARDIHDHVKCIGKAFGESIQTVPDFKFDLFVIERNKLVKIDLSTAGQVAFLTIRAEKMRDFEKHAGETDEDYDKRNGAFLCALDIIKTDILTGVLPFVAEDYQRKRRVYMIETEVFRTWAVNKGYSLINTDENPLGENDHYSQMLRILVLAADTHWKNADRENGAKQPIDQARITIDLDR